MTDKKNAKTNHDDIQSLPDPSRDIGAGYNGPPVNPTTNESKSQPAQPQPDKPKE